MDLINLATTIGYIVILVLFFIAYSYIEKLERIGCPCAEHPYRAFIKGFSIFAIIYALIVIFVSPRVIFNTFGIPGAFVYAIFKIIFFVLLIIYFFLVMKYTDYLIREKCKCSEDARREAIYYWSIIEIIFITIIIILPLLQILAATMMVLVITSVNYAKNNSNHIQEVVMNPIKSIKSVPASLKASAKAASKLMKKRR